MKKHLTPIGAFALAFGCSIGWGAFMMPGSSFLPISGILGTVISVIVGAAIMLVIAWNYHTMMNLQPKAGGAFAFTVHGFGYDHGFLCAWFLCLTYLGLIWANGSAFALVARYLLGEVFQGHYLYSVANYDIYLEEVLFCMAMITLCVGICMFRKRLAMGMQITFAAVLLLGIFICFLAALRQHDPKQSLLPLFAPSQGPLPQIIRTLAIMPWAYVGFESISHSAEEFDFPVRKSFRIMALAVVATALAYICLLLLCVLALPEGYGNWMEYINDLGNLSGINAVPTFSAIRNTMGTTGLALLGATMMGALITSVIGNAICASRLLCVMGESRILPAWFEKKTEDGIPKNALLFILLASVFMPFLGRTAIGWHVDVSNIGATIAYGYTSIVAYRTAKAGGNRRALGLAGMVISALFLVMLLIPNNTLAVESYLILAGWIIIGFVFNYIVFKRDREHRFGRSSVVWISLFALLVFTAFSFMWQSSEGSATRIAGEISAHYADADGSYVSALLNQLHLSHMISFIVVFAIVLMAVRILLGNYAIMNGREMEGVQALSEANFKMFTDRLTGVGSVHAYRDREHTMDRRIENGEAEAFGLVLCDLNDLKKVNDTLGHQAGDTYIQKGAKLICDYFAHSPVYRIGGDEFAVLLEGRDFLRREEILQAMKEEMERNAQSGDLVISFGMAEWIQGQDEKFADVFARADVYMYQMKERIKGRK